MDINEVITRMGPIDYEDSYYIPSGVLRRFGWYFNLGIFNLKCLYIIVVDHSDLIIKKIEHLADIPAIPKCIYCF